ncbi:uncharacterized protein K452DRAFT_149349 [Aplosporella prunicola CBS 121167]|uniref:Uncharacterized protein n=1 Tax=Aplosporella prunicola CBS 121167 TaxID=1176127 RepID=A0A6A6AWN6_9PEZI|nr:uncharacterized protein K452DRAFT_149349 [Aplosporella prunicola CBS 121167]KAF2136026.1 hypothetical protein K452DRAFT_149349 [Aplosporella prunicola CBS 121167]
MFSIPHTPEFIHVLSHESKHRLRTESTLTRKISHTHSSDHVGTDTENPNNDHPDFKPAGKTPLTVAIQNIWPWELSGIVLSIACMIAIIVLLPLIHDKPLSKWPVSVPPNTILSAFITVIKSSMLLVVAESISELKWLHFEKTASGRPLDDLEHFDRASRGPWGSVLFLYHVRGRSLFVCLGAFITIVALAMEPFGQLIISYETRYVPGHQTATVPVAYKYNASSSEWTSEWAYHVHAMQGTLLNGLFEVNAALPFNCPSGNCTWPNVTSLALCGSCADITNDTVRSWITMKIWKPQESGCYTDTKSLGIDCIADIRNGTLISNCTQWPPANFDAGRHVEITHKYTSPNNASFTTVEKYCLQTEGSIDQALGNSHLESKTRDYKEGYILGSSSQYKYDSSMVSGVPFNASGFAVVVGWLGIPPFHFENFEKGDLCSSRVEKMTECQIYWCLKTYENLKVTNGSMTTPVVHNIPIHQNKTQRIDDVDSAFIFPPVDNYNPRTRPEGREAVTIGRSGMSNILGLFERLFGQDNAFDGHLDFTYPLQRNNDPQKSLLNILENMNNLIRVAPNSSTTATGTAWVPETYIIIRWPWIILPSVLVLLTAIFFTATIFISHKAPLWKSSLIPLLFHGLHGWKESELSVMGQKEMDKAAKGMEARLSENEKGDLKFVNMAES